MKRILSLIVVATMILSALSFQVVSAQTETSHDAYKRDVTVMEDTDGLVAEMFGLTEIPEGTYPFLILETITFVDPLNCTVTGANAATRKWAGHMLAKLDTLYENFTGAEIATVNMEGEDYYVGFTFEEDNGFAFNDEIPTADAFRKQFMGIPGKEAFPGNQLNKAGSIADIEEMTLISGVLLTSKTFSFTSDTTIRTYDYTTAGITDGSNVDYSQKKITIYVKDGVEVSKEEFEGGGAATVYTVTFKNGGSVISSADVEEGAAVTAPEAPTAPVDADEAYNYTFVGWSDGSNTYASNEIPVATDNVEYTAVFNSVKKTYTITFSVDGATTTQTVEHGETPSYAGTPSKEGYTFTGWDPAIVPATGAATYTAQFSLIPPTEYEITFVVEGVETKINVIEGQTPVYPNGTPAKDGYNFTGWSPAIVPAAGAATYTAQFELIPVEPTESVLDITAVDRITGDIFPGSTLPTVVVNVKGKEETIEAARLHRVHTTFDYEAGDNPLDEMGMLFVPKAVVDEAEIEATVDAIVAADIAKDANCSNLPGEITGGTTNVVFKAGLVNVPEAYKGITIYAIPYYTLSGGERQYHGVIETTF